MNCIFCNNFIKENGVICKRCNLVRYCNFECFLNDEENHDNNCSKIQLPNKQEYKIDSWYDLAKFINENETSLIYSRMLQWPMTIFYIITKRLFIDYPQFKNKIPIDFINIYIIGAQIEAYYLQDFKILTLLLKNINLFNIFMVGNQLDSKLVGLHKLNEHLNIFCIKSLYHEIEDISLPHLAIAFNAGLPAYQSWIKTLVKLKDNQIPSYFTDYNLSCYSLAQHAIEICPYLSDCLLTEPVRNPFMDDQEISLAEFDDQSEISNQWIFALTTKIYQKEIIIENV